MPNINADMSRVRQVVHDALKDINLETLGHHEQRTEVIRNHVLQEGSQEYTFLRDFRTAIIKREVDAGVQLLQSMEHTVAEKIVHEIMDAVKKKMVEAQ